jgi:hypothetical protein
MAPSLTIICPTFGRTTLASTVRDIVAQMEPGDQFIVTADGPCPAVKAFVEECEGVLQYVDGPVRVGDYGCTPCDRGVKLARGSAIWFVGDDDRYPPGALTAIRNAVARQPDVVHIFSMMHTGRLLRGSIEPCQVSGQQAVVPNRSDLPSMTLYPPNSVQVSDWFWIRNTIAVVGRHMFHDDIVCILEKQNFGAAL